MNAYHKRLGFNFEIKPEDTIKNPGLRQVAKICLNNLWGKVGQTCGMDDFTFFYDYNTLSDTSLTIIRSFLKLGTS